MSTQVSKYQPKYQLSPNFIKINEAVVVANRWIQKSLGSAVISLYFEFKTRSKIDGVWGGGGIEIPLFGFTKIIY